MVASFTFESLTNNVTGNSFSSFFFTAIDVFNWWEGKMVLLISLVRIWLFRWRRAWWWQWWRSLLVLILWNLANWLSWWNLASSGSWWSSLILTWNYIICWFVSCCACCGHFYMGSRSLIILISGSLFSSCCLGCFDIC